MKKKFLFLWLITTIFTASSMQHQMIEKPSTLPTPHEAEENDWVQIGKTSSELSIIKHPGFETLPLLLSGQQEDTTLIIPQEGNEQEENVEQQEKGHLNAITLQQKDAHDSIKKPWYKKKSVNIVGIVGACACASAGLIVITYNLIKK